jgi:hypothetical protein
MTASTPLESSIEGMVMKVILSRKGFDSGYGGYPSPILPDGWMISLKKNSLNKQIAQHGRMDSS